MTTSSSSTPFVEHPILVVAVPAYNEERYIRETLISLKAQTFTDFRVLIGDNASTDRTGEICQEICAEDARFAYFRQPENVGSAGNARWLQENSRSPYFIWIGAHDLLAPDYLQRTFDTLSASPKASICFTDVRLIDEDGAYLRDKDGGSYHVVSGTAPQRYRRVLARIGPCEAVNSLFRRAALDDLGTRVASADRMVICHAAYCGPFKKVEAPLFLRRMFHTRDAGISERDARMTRIAGASMKETSYQDVIRVFKSKFDALEPSFYERLRFRITLYWRYYQYYRWNRKKARKSRRAIHAKRQTG